MLDKFLKYAITEKRFSEHTVIAYEKDLRQFLDFVELESDMEIVEVKNSLIRNWMVSLLENDYSAISVHRLSLIHI